MSVRTAKTLAAVQKHFGKTQEAAAAHLGMNPKYVPEGPYPFGVHVETKKDGAGWGINIGFKNYTNLITFTLSYYPACCGSMLFHHFVVNELKMTQEQLDEIMAAFFDENKFNPQDDESNNLFGGSNRIEVMMVERRDLAIRDPMQEVEPVEDPRIKFKPLWNFFHKYAKRVRTRLEVNYNTCNVLHNMEVIL